MAAASQPELEEIFDSATKRQKFVVEKDSEENVEPGIENLRDVIRMPELCRDAAVSLYRTTAQ